MSATRKAHHDEGHDGGLPRNYLRACLALLLGEAPAHGYDLLGQITELGLAATDHGGVYRMLRAMEADGLVESYQEDSLAGPRRRIYRLTSSGRVWLAHRAHALAESNRHVSAYLGRYIQGDRQVLSTLVG